ncbi:MAG: polysaccharide deacetylase family protein [Selenomonadaceae bacterium]|nr:polysaccharide deacetylase family protein [Selenomonadaceae bacterium]MBR4696051.1 polysaccharide deacetylase family protein [Selenomonadaceae bacterium]
MSYKKLGLIVLLVLAVIVGGLIYIRDHVIEAPHPGADITDLSASYQAREEIAKAMEERGKADLQPAEVVTTLPANISAVAIVFDGLPERPLALRLLDVLARHSVPAVFFVEGQNAAEQPETLEAIQEAGQEIGNYTFVGVAGIEKQPVEEQISQLCRTQKVIVMLSELAPKYFRAPRVRYEDEILKSVKAAGIPYAVKENSWFRAEGMETPEQVAAYAATVPFGSIIAVPVARFVEPKAVTPGKSDDKPAVDMKPTIKDEKKEKIARKVDLADKVDWLLSSLRGRGLEIAPLERFRKIRYIPAVSQPQPPPEKEGE